MTTSPTLQSERGVTLIETAIAIGVMGVGALGSVGVLAQGVQKTNTGPGST
jgi:Tfp pilus assembly protein PilV